MALPVRYVIRNLVKRWQRSLLATLGIALTVTVMVSLLSMAAGFRSALKLNGRAENFIVTQSGAISELVSWIPREQANTIVVDERIARDNSGNPLASGEVVAVSSMTRLSDGGPANVGIRGVTERAFAVRDSIVITQGRRFKPGAFEVIVGDRIRERISNLNLGNQARILGQNWKVVGVFSSGGAAFGSEVWGDYDLLEPIGHPVAGNNSITVRLTSPEALDGFNRNLQSNPQMRVEVVSEKQFYQRQAGPLVIAIALLAIFVGAIMGIGAIIGAMNTMYGMVAARTGEIGVLRALGFSRISMAVAFVSESVFLAFIGGVLGCVLALPLNGIMTGTGNTMSFSEVAFAFQTTPVVLVTSVTFALAIGLFGGLLPAVRAARLPLTVALREL
ncbi:MAG: ABC transporter permease [Candidatus Sulfotelmatobacter sp.]